MINCSLILGIFWSRSGWLKVA